MVLMRVWIFWQFSFGHYTKVTYKCRSQWPRGLRRRSEAARLLRLWVRIPPGTWMSVVSFVCCQVEVSASSWSLVQRIPTDCGASLWYRNLMNEKALAEWSLLAKNKQTNKHYIEVIYSAAARLLRLRVRFLSGGMDVFLLWVLCVVR